MKRRFSHWPIVAALCWPLTAAADDAAVRVSHALSPEVALGLATAARAACRAQDFQVAVAVVDRHGAPQVVLRDELAGNFTYDIALLKARTAAGFRQSTLALGASLPERPELQAINALEQILMVGGGVPVAHNGSVVGAIGISGAPTPQDDDACAQAGIEAIADTLLF